MSQSNLSDLFLGVRAQKGDSEAQQILDGAGRTNEAHVEKLDLAIESLSMSLQMQFSRIDGSQLKQLRTKHIGKELQTIIEEGITTLVAQLGCDPKVLRPAFKLLFQRAYDAMGQSAKESYQYVKSLNLQLDFSKIVFQIQTFPYQDIIRTLKCLVIASVLRRYKRRLFLPSCE